MGNSIDKQIENTYKQHNTNHHKLNTLSTSNPCDLITHSEWISQIKQQQTQYHSQQTTEMKHDDMTDYELFIEYLVFNTNIIGYSEISIIARLVRYFVGSVNGVSIFTQESFTFSGIRIAIAIHPITSQIFIADEYNIYQFNEHKPMNDINRFQIIGKIPSKHQNEIKITDLAFSPNGNSLFCLFNFNTYSVFAVVITNENIEKENTILYYTAYDKMDYLKYDFNYYYFDCLYFINLLNLDLSHYRKNIRQNSIMYTLDHYKQQLWIICNSIYYPGFETELQFVNQPLLIRIPFEFVSISRELESLLIKMRDMSQNAMNDIDNDEYEDKLIILQSKMDELKLKRTNDRNRCEIVDLYILLKLKEIHLNANMNKRNEVPAKISLTAFDVDKLHGGVYLISNDHQFWRIEKGRRNTLQQQDDECWYIKANKKYPKHFVYEQKYWNVTHNAPLHDVLPEGLPLGVCNVRYDSVTGRIIVADNYKIQALYI